MASISWLLGYVALSSGLWAAGAFLLELRHTGRLVLTTAVPGIVAGLQACAPYLDGRDGWPDEWVLLFFLYGLLVGGFATIVALPIWFVFEERIGWRAR
jgi:hypothetical protein